MNTQLPGDRESGPWPRRRNKVPGGSVPGKDGATFEFASDGRNSRDRRTKQQTTRQLGKHFQRWTLSRAP